MRVICIDNKPRRYSTNLSLLATIEEGNIYEVYYEGMGYGIDGTCELAYCLVGINKRPNCIAANRFVPISDIDETELVNYKEECI